MTHKNGIYHETATPITTMVKITITNVANQTGTAMINLAATFLHPTHTKGQSRSHALHQLRLLTKRDHRNMSPTGDFSDKPMTLGGSCTQQLG